MNKYIFVYHREILIMVIETLQLTNLSFVIEWLEIVYSLWNADRNWTETHIVPAYLSHHSGFFVFSNAQDTFVAFSNMTFMAIVTRIPFIQSYKQLTQVRKKKRKLETSFFYHSFKEFYDLFLISYVFCRFKWKFYF